MFKTWRMLQLSCGNQILEIKACLASCGILIFHISHLKVDSHLSHCISKCKVESQKKCSKKQTKAVKMIYQMFFLCWWPIKKKHECLDGWNTKVQCSESGRLIILIPCNRRLFHRSLACIVIMNAAAALCSRAYSIWIQAPSSFSFFIIISLSLKSFVPHSQKHHHQN